MNTLQRIAVVGAPGTGKTWLTRTLTELLRERGTTVHRVDAPRSPWCEGEGRQPDALEMSALAQTQAEAVIAFGSGTVIADTTPLLTAVLSQHHCGDEGLYRMALAHQGLYDLTLITGLDLPRVDEGLHHEASRTREAIDGLLRQALMRQGLAFRVVYGQGLVRLNNALLAMGLPAVDQAAWRRREAAQFDLNEGRTPWSCEKCSDPDCEHRLFTGLLKS